MESSGDRHGNQPSAPAPKRGLQMMLIILIAMALLAIYSNAQKLREKQIESVTFTPATSSDPVAPPRTSRR